MQKIAQAPYNNVHVHVHVHTEIDAPWPYMYSRVPDSHYTALRFTMVNTRAAFLEVWFSEREAALQWKTW